MTRRLLTIVAVAVLLGAAAALAATGASNSHHHAATVHARVTYQGRPILWWARHAVAARRQANSERAQLELARKRLTADLAPAENVYEHAATIAATAYHVDAATLIRKGRCESGDWTHFHNPSGASGPWQFLPSTWASTPFAAFSPYDPVAAALAAAWMHSASVRRGDEWVCK